MKEMVNECLEIPLGGKRKMFVYIQSYNYKQIQINIYYYDKEPYDSSPIGEKSMVLGLSMTLRL